MLYIWRRHITGRAPCACLLRVGAPSCLVRPCEWVISQEWISISLTCGWVMSRERMRHVTYINKSCDKCDCGRLQVERLASASSEMEHPRVLSDRMNESCHICDWVMSHTWPYVCVREKDCVCTQATYGVACVSRIDKIISLFCKRDL